MPIDRLGGWLGTTATRWIGPGGLRSSLNNSLHATTVVRVLVLYSARIDGRGVCHSKIGKFVPVVFMYISSKPKSHGTAKKNKPSRDKPMIWYGMITHGYSVIRYDTPCVI